MKKKRQSFDAQSASVSLRFNLVDPYAVAWAREHAATALQDVAKHDRVAIRDLVCRAFTDGIPPRKLGKLIEPHLGQLDANSTRQIDDARSELARKGVKFDRLERAIQKLMTRLRTERAEFVARTEISKASNNGRLLGWKAAAAKGLLDPQRTKIVWIATPGDGRTCELCIKMHHQVTSLEKPFATPNGQLWCPPLHDGCRCTTVLKFIDDA